MSNSLAGAPPAYPPTRQVLWPMALMFLAANLYNIDRLIVSVLAEPIRHDLNISDFQMSLLLGLAYSLLSGICGLFLGYLIDRRVRKVILAASIILWSVSTIAGGLAPDFKWFFAFRALVGLGETAVAPAAMSLIADLFPARQRGRALGGYFLGAVLGSSLSSIVPGLIAGAHLQLTVPVFGRLSVWRTTFVLCGLVGPWIGLLFLTMREPARHGFGPAQGRVSVADNFRYLWRQRAVMIPLYAGFCLFYVAMVGITAWSAVFLMRAYHLTLPALGPRLGLMLLIGGGGGYVCGGLLADSAPLRREGGKLLMLSILPFAALVGAFAALAPNATLALVMLGAVSLVTPMLNVAMNASVQELAPNGMRGFSYSLLGVVNALLAGSTGAPLVALATERVFKNPAMIGFSFMLVAGPGFLTSALCFALSLRAFSRAMRTGGELAGVLRASRS